MTVMADDPNIRFVSESAFLRYWPYFMVAFGGWLATRGGYGVATMFVLAACGAASVLPWRYAVFDDGLALQFAFGKRRFLPRSEVTVRVNRAGGVAHREGCRFGYPLSDRFVERRLGSLRAILAERGYRLV